MTLEDVLKQDAFWAEIKSRPDDTLPLKVFADWLDERNDRSLAFALRWAAERKRFPHITPGGRVVAWWRKPARVRRLGGLPHPWMLPPVVYDQLRYRQGNKTKVVSVPQAFQRLANALAELRRAVGWNI